MSQQPLIATFLTELDERAQALNRDLLALEKEVPGSARLDLFKALFRTAHSLKGAAGAVRAEMIEVVCHRLEEVFAAARDGRLTFAPELFQLFFSCVDAIQDAGQRLRRNQDLADGPLARCLPRLEESIGLVSENGEPTQLSPLPPPDQVRDRAEDAVVRITAQKLDVLMARSGELLSVSHRADARVADVAELRALVKQCHADWRIVERTVARVAPSDGARAPSESVREAPGTLDNLLRRAPAAGKRHGASLQRLSKELERLNSALVDDRRVIDQTTVPLDAEVRRARMLPFTVACEGLDRIVRDLVKASGKRAEVLIVGGDIELDRSIIQGLKGPLLHLVRNAVDHGVEPIGKRRAAGKSEAGRITVSAVLRGLGVEVSVSDDGPGLDMAAIAEQARLKRLATTHGTELARCVFLPGFTTVTTVTQVSGRGIGLDAVKTDVEAMRGSVDIGSEPGRGTRFVLSLPLTLTTIRALLVEADGHTFALDAASVVRLLRVGPDQLASVEGRTMLVGEDRPVPVVPLCSLLGLETAARERLPIVLLEAEHRRAAVVVDDFIGEQEIVVRGLGVRLIRVRHITGATILPTGRVALILNAADLVRGAQDVVPLPMVAEPAVAKLSVTKKRVLVADDSVTTRSLERSILEFAGYEVITAADGAEAWRLLEEGGADVVVSDVEMPRMDGFAFTEAIRGSKRFRELPVILVSARASEQDKARGLQVGANTYLVKSAFDQKSLLDALAQLL